MSLNKKAAILLAVSTVICAMAAVLSLKTLCKCLKDINNAGAENSNISDHFSQVADFGKLQITPSFLCIGATFKVAENNDCCYFYTNNQFMQLTKSHDRILYFCYDREVGSADRGEKECSRNAVLAAKECIGEDFKENIHVSNCAFDGKCYTFSVICGSAGTSTVKVCADTGKIALIDMRNVNGF